MSDKTQLLEKQQEMYEKSNENNMKILSLQQEVEKLTKNEISTNNNSNNK